MNLNLTEEQQMTREMVRDFAEKELKKRAIEIDRNEKFPFDIFKKMAELNLMGMAFPEEYGGGGTDNVCYAIGVEEISRACASTGVIMSVNNSLVCDPINIFGTEKQKKEWLTPLAKGELIGCFALTEPGAGSDAGNQQTTAVKKGDKYVLNGNKIFITSGGVADVAVVFAMTDKEKKMKGISTFLVKKGTPGFSVGKIEKKLGIRGTGSAELIFEDCEIPEENILGKEGAGFKIAMMTLDGGRIGIAAQAVGIAQACLDESVTYSKNRRQFDQPISNFQAVQWMLADMATATEGARLLTYKAAYLKDQKKRYSKEAAMAKLFASDAAVKASQKAVQIHGGYGFSKEYVIERFFRDAKITEIYEGTSEVQRMVIAANILS